MGYLKGPKSVYYILSYDWLRYILPLGLAKVGSQLRKRMNELVNELMTTVFVELPLASPWSAN